MEGITSNPAITCTGDLGYPPKNLSAEILKSGDTQFTKLSEVTIDNSVAKCSDTTRTLEIPLVWSAEIDDAIVRCVIEDEKQETTTHSSNDTIDTIKSTYSFKNSRVCVQLSTCTW